MVKRLHAGRAAESGVLACLLARRGFTAPLAALEKAGWPEKTVRQGKKVVLLLAPLQDDEVLDRRVGYHEKYPGHIGSLQKFHDPAVDGYTRPSTTTSST